MYHRGKSSDSRNLAASNYRDKGANAEIEDHRTSTEKSHELMATIDQHSISKQIQLHPDSDGEEESLLGSRLPDAQNRRSNESALRTGADGALSVAMGFVPVPGAGTMVSGARAARNFVNTLEVKSKIDDDISAARGHEDAGLLHSNALADMSEEDIGALGAASRLTRNKAVAQGIQAIVPQFIVDKLRSKDEKEQAVEAASVLTKGYSSTHAGTINTILKGNEKKIEKYHAYIERGQDNNAIKYLAKYLIGVAKSADMPEPKSSQYDYDE